MSSKKELWQARMDQRAANQRRSRLYKDQGRMKTISENEKVIEWAVIRKAAMRLARTCCLGKMTVKGFVRRLVENLRISGYEIGRICEARLFQLYLRMFYFAVDRPKYYKDREFSAYYHQLYLTA